MSGNWPIVSLSTCDFPSKRILIILTLCNQVLPRSCLLSLYLSRPNSSSNSLTSHPSKSTTIHIYSLPSPGYEHLSNSFSNLGSCLIPCGLLSFLSKRSFGPFLESGYSSVQPVEIVLQKFFRHDNILAVDRFLRYRWA